MKVRASILVAATALMAGAAQAQVQTGPGFFGYLDGMYHLEPGRSSGVRWTDNPVSDAKTNVGDGWGLEGRLGWRFDGPWDIALGGRYSNFSAGKKAHNNFGAFRVTDADLWNVDLEVGYTLSGPGWGVRPTLGIRFLRFRETESDPVQAFNSRQRLWGVGPHLGVDGALRVTESISLIGGIDTTFLFGRLKDSSSAVINQFQAITGSTNKSQFIWQIGAKAGVDWEVTPQVHLVVGYRVQYNDGIRFQTLVNNGALNPRGRSGLLEHGPFLRLAYNWGAPPPAAAVPLAPVPVTPTQYMVFFDFDRATLTAQALSTIRQAADAAKAGIKTRIGVTGHADRSGTDAYNMALSLRRANAVQNQLVREGIRADQITVVGRGESQPLVPTADGVREAQNRRVEIVLQ